MTTPPSAQAAAPRVLILAADPEPAVRRLAERAPEAVAVPCASYEDLPQLLAREAPDIALVFKIGRQPFPSAELFGCASLRWLHNSGAGIDHLAPWDRAQVTVTNSSGIHGELMSQFTAWAILNHRLRLPHYAALQASREWRSEHADSVAGSTLVIVGFGTIGAEVGRVARALGLRVIGVRAHPAPSEHADEVVGADRLAEALGQGDYISIVLPLTPGTRGMIGRAAFAAMKPGAYLVNTGRGGVVDEAALIEALEARRLSGALLDVFDTEPLSPESPLWSAPNTTILPHITGDPADWRARVVEMFLDNLENWVSGEPLFNVIDPGRGY